MQLSQIPSVEIDDHEQMCCNQVRTEATPRQLEILALFGDGLTPQEVACRLGISIKTVDTYKTGLLALCRYAWNLPLNEKLNYCFLHTKFAKVRPKDKSSTQSSLKELSIEERHHCDQVIAMTTRRQLEILHLFGDGLTPQEVAHHLDISIKTVDTHKTRLLALCRYTWNLPLDKWLDYRFLNTKFADFSSYIKQKSLVHIM